MGFMTSVGILNDRWHEVKADPQKFVDQIDYGMNGHEYPAGAFHFVTVLPSHHADDMEIILAYGNSFSPLTSRPRLSKHASIAEQRKSLQRLKSDIETAQKRLKVELKFLKADLRALAADVEV